MNTGSKNRLRSLFLCPSAIFIVFFTYWLYCYNSVNNVVENSHQQDSYFNISYQDRTSRLVWRHPFIFLTSPTSSSSSSSEGPYLVILITTRPQSYSKRDVIRRTWASEFRRLYDGRVETVFVSGLNNKDQQTTINDNHTSESDLLIADFEDTYFNLSLKTYVAFRFGLQRYPRAELFIKVDDDSIIFPGNLVKYLRLVADSGNNITWESSRTFLCYQYVGAKPRRFPFGSDAKFVVPRDVYEQRIFPPYCSGHAYLGTRSALRAVVDYARDRLDYYLHLEDILFTGILAEKCNVTRVHSENWHPLVDSLSTYEDALSIHMLHDDAQMIREWERYIV